MENSVCLITVEIHFQIGADATVICLAQSPQLASTLIDHPAPVALHIKVSLEEGSTVATNR